MNIAKKIKRYYQEFGTSLAGRLSIIFFIGLLVAHGLTMFWVIFERYQSGRSMMLAYLGKDVAASVEVLNYLQQSERVNWLKKLERPDYQYVLGSVPPSEAGTGIASAIRASVAAEVNEKTQLGEVGITKLPDGERFHLPITLNDGSTVTLLIERPKMRISWVTQLMVLLQLAILALITVYAVRIVTQPLHRLTEAANQLDLTTTLTLLDESGPPDVSRAIKAFNEMRRRIEDHLRDRIQILAAISHDLRTPLTRMRLRIELIEEKKLQTKLLTDLNNMQELIDQGIDYAGSALASKETLRVIDLNAFIDGIVCDYIDAGKPVKIQGAFSNPLETRSLALRRIVVNLLDNALKFAGSATVILDEAKDRGCEIKVIDEGPGIPENQLNDVFKPFFRLENSRNRDTGGAGLGLAIVIELAAAIDASVRIRNRDTGGLEVSVQLKQRRAQQPLLQ